MGTGIQQHSRLHTNALPTNQASCARLCMAFCDKLGTTYIIRHNKHKKMICEVEMQRKALVGQTAYQSSLGWCCGWAGLAWRSSSAEKPHELVAAELAADTPTQALHKDGLTTMRLLLRALCRDSDKHINCKQTLSITHTQGCRDDCMSYNDDSTVKIELAAAEFFCRKREKMVQR